MLSWVLFFGLLPGAADAPAGQASAPKQDPAVLARLIEQLGDRDFLKREAAVQTLTARGVGVLPDLLKARNHPDPEIRRRIGEMIPPLERSILLAPKRVTLSGTHTVKEYIAEIKKQTGYNLVANDSETSARINFSCNETPFWEALDRFCDAAGLSISQNHSDDQIRLASPPSALKARSYSTIFRVVPKGFRYERRSDFGQLPRNPVAGNRLIYESLTLDLSVAVESRAPFMKTGRTKLTLAVDEENRSMLASNFNDYNNWQMGYYYGGGARNYVMDAQANLTLPSRTSRLVARLKGVLPVTLLSEQRPVVVTDAIMQAKGKKLTAGDSSFQIDDVSTVGKQLHVRITYNEETTETRYDYSKIQSLQQRVELRDAKGNKINAYLNNFMFNTPTSAQFTLISNPSSDKSIGPPAKLVYITWLQMEHEIPFELHDLPLP